MTTIAVQGAPVEGTVQTSGAARLLWDVGILVFYLLVALVEFRSTWVHPTARIIGPAGDNLQALWFLRWTSFAISHGHSPFYTYLLDYPTGTNLMWNTSVPLLGFVLWPLIQLEGAIFAFNLAVTVSIALSAWCTYLAARTVGATTAGALIGGLLYGCCPFLTGQALGHLYLVASFTPPLILLLIAHSTRRNWGILPTGLCLGILFAAQLLISIEVLFTEGAAVVVGAALWYLLGGRQSRANWRLVAGSIGLAAITFLVLDSVPLLELLTGPQRPSTPFHPPGSNPIDLTNLLVPTQMQWFNPLGTRITRHFIGFLAEWGGYLGLPLVVLLVWVRSKSRRRLLVNVLAVSSIIAVLLALGPHLVVLGHVTPIRLPWALLDKIPVLSSVIPSRLMMYADLCASLIVALGLSELPAIRLKKPRHIPAQSLAIGGLAALSLITWLPTPSYPTFVIAGDPFIKPPRFFTGRQVQRIKQGSDVLVAPLAEGSYLGPQMWQLASDMRFAMPGGYAFISGPPGTVGPPPTPLATIMREVEMSGRAPLNALTRSLVLEGMHRWQVSTVIVGPMQYEHQMVTLFTGLLGRAPKFDEGVYVWWNVAVPEQKVSRVKTPLGILPPGSAACTPPLPSKGALQRALTTSKKDRDAWLVLSAVYNARPDLQKAFPESSVNFDSQLLRWASSYGVTVDSDAPILRPYRSELTQLRELSNLSK